MIDYMALPGTLRENYEYTEIRPDTDELQCASLK